MTSSGRFSKSRAKTPPDSLLQNFFGRPFSGLVLVDQQPWLMVGEFVQWDVQANQLKVCGMAIDYLVLGWLAGDISESGICR